MLAQPQAELVLDDAGDERRGFARRQAFLGLPGELRVAHLRREHVAGVVPDVLGRQLQAARQQVAELAELTHRFGEAEAEAVDVRAALRGRDQVDVALLEPRAAVRAPDHGPVDAFVLAFDLADERFVRQPFGGLERLAQVLRQPFAVEPLFLLAGLLDVEADAQARAQHGLGLEHVLELRQREIGAVEIGRVRPEADRGAGVALADLADDFELGMHLPVLERDVVFLAAAAHPALEVLRQRVDHRDADAVQAARELVAGVGGELSARVQPGEDQLDAAHLLFRVDVDRHAAAVVDDLERPVLVEGHVDLAAVARQRFVDAVVDDFVREVVGPTGVGVHARASPDGLESAQDFDVLSGVGLAHSWIGPRARVGGEKRANSSS